MFIDSHCHLDRLDLQPYDNDFSKMLLAAQERQVNKMLCVSISMQEFPAMYELVKQHPSVYASVGVHPSSAGDEPVSAKWLEERISLDKIVAVGETGLDYYYQTDTKAQQMDSFAVHLEVAGANQLPVIVHTREARKDTLDIIKARGSSESAGVLHCFTESWNMAKAAMDMNYCISFSGIVTFRNAEELREVVKKMPLERILIETDSPYLAPVPHRGKKNEPKFVVDVAQCIADLKGISVEQLAKITSENFYRLFPKAR